LFPQRRTDARGHNASNVKDVSGKNLRRTSPSDLNASSGGPTTKAAGNPSVMIALELVSVLGLAIAFLFEATAMKCRVLLNSSSKDAYAVTIVKIFMLVNRFGIALSMPFFGLMIDLGVPTDRIVLLFSAAFFVAFTAIELAVVHSEASDIGTHRLMRYVFSVDLPSDKPQKAKLKLTFKGLLVGTLNAAGLSLPAISASLFPDYSTFLIQTGFLINSVAAILNVLLIDVSNTKSLNSEAASSTTLNNIYSKAVAYLGAAAILFAVGVSIHG
jgi:hypothetical protein